jgi:hypothetical protein
MATVRIVPRYHTVPSDVERKLLIVSQSAGLAVPPSLTGLFDTGATSDPSAVTAA